MPLRTSNPRAALCLALLAAVSCGSDEGAFSVSTEEDEARELSEHFELPPSARRLQIKTQPVGPASIARDLALPGRVGFDQEHRALIAAGLDGTITEIDVRLGDEVRAGQRLALISSRELARARSGYVEAIHRLEFAQAAFEREARLWERRITPEESYLKAQHELEEARLFKTTSGQELLALGLSQEELDSLVEHSDDSGVGEPARSFTHHERHAPIAGVVVEKRAVLGAAVTRDSVLFEVADLSTVWVDLRVQAALLAQLQVGTPVLIESRELGKSCEAHVSYLGARVEHDTQTALARIEVPNESGDWRPGLFVTVLAQLGRREVELAVPVASIQRFPGSAGGDEVDRVFVEHSGNGFEAREVVLGMQGTRAVEVLEGLRPGERVAVDQSLLLKSIWLGQGGLEE